MDDRQAFSTEQQQQQKFRGKHSGPLKTKVSHREKRKELYFLLSFLIELTWDCFTKMSLSELGPYPCDLESTRLFHLWNL